MRNSAMMIWQYTCNTYETWLKASFGLTNLGTLKGVATSVPFTLWTYALGHKKGLGTQYLCARENGFRVDFNAPEIL